jgi:hypothetical protein
MTTLLISILVPAVSCAFVVSIIVLVLRHLRFTREKMHDERLKMIESGYPLEEPESTKRQQKYMHNAFWISFWMVFLVPSAAFSSAASATDRVEHLGYLLAIWIGASVASVAAVVCAAVLMMYSRSSREDEDDMRMPMKKPKKHDG